MERGNLVEEADRSPRSQRKGLALLWSLNELLGSFLNLRSFHLVILGGLATCGGIGGFIMGLAEGRGFVSDLVSLAIGAAGACLLLVCILEHSKK
jgi:branched-subunit amino acid ABC-type transport system permease component